MYCLILSPGISEVSFILQICDMGKVELTNQCLLSQSGESIDFHLSERYVIILIQLMKCSPGKKLFFTISTNRFLFFLILKLLSKQDAVKRKE